MGKIQQFFKAIAGSRLGDVVANRIRNKLAFGMLAVGLIPLFVLGFALYHASITVIGAQMPDQLEPVMFTMWKVFLIVAVGASVLILIVSLMFANGLTRADRCDHGHALGHRRGAVRRAGGSRQPG